MGLPLLNAVIKVCFDSELPSLSILTDLFLTFRKPFVSLPSSRTCSERTSKTMFFHWPNLSLSSLERSSPSSRSLQERRYTCLLVVITCKKTLVSSFVFIAHLSISRNTGVWGDDAHVFNPQRWMNQDSESTNALGMYANVYVHLFLFRVFEIDWPTYG